MKTIYTNTFKRDAKRVAKRGYANEPLKEVIRELESGESLSYARRDHPLQSSGGLRDCHVTPDWILLYRYSEDRTNCFWNGRERTATFSDKPAYARGMSAKTIGTLFLG